MLHRVQAFFFTACRSVPIAFERENTTACQCRVRISRQTLIIETSGSAAKECEARTMTGSRIERVS